MSDPRPPAEPRPEAFMHVHEDDDESHDTCPDCGSGDPMRLCEDCLFYAGQDAR